MRPSSGWSRHGHYPQTVNPGEIVRITGVDGEVVGDRCCRDHRVVGPCGGLSAGAAKGDGNSSKRTCRRGVKRKRGEVRLCLLQVCLSRGSLLFVLRDERSNRQFRQRDRRDEGLFGKFGSILEPGQHDQCRGVQHPARWRGRRAHSRASRNASMSLRNAPGSTGGRCLRRSTSAVADRPGLGTGRSSATGFPALVILIRSPRDARSTTSPPLLRRSRMLTSPMRAMYHA